MNDTLYLILSIAIVAAITLTTRALPFVFFGGRKELPKSIDYLSLALPPAIMAILAVYCLRNTDFASSPYGLPAVIASLAVILLQWFKKNMYISIVVGTVLYMVLIRVM